MLDWYWQSKWGNLLTTGKNISKGFLETKPTYLSKPIYFGSHFFLQISHMYRWIPRSILNLLKCRMHVKLQLKELLISNYASHVGLKMEIWPCKVNLMFCVRMKYKKGNPSTCYIFIQKHLRCVNSYVQTFLIFHTSVK